MPTLEEMARALEGGSARRGGVLGALADPFYSDYPTEPSLTEAQTGARPSGAMMTDWGAVVGPDWQPIAETPRPSVLPVTVDPSGKTVAAMPKVLDVLGNVGGGWAAPRQAGGVVLGLGGAKRPRAEPIEGYVRPPPAVTQDVDAPFPQYAEQYPPVGPPVPAIDKKTGRPYMEKQRTPEAEEFKKVREKIVRDMERSGYEPYFDPAQRYYVDPSSYPPNVDTRSIVPKKQATIDKDMATIGSAEARQRLNEAYDRGLPLEDAADWYAMGQLEKAFIDELGEKAGRAAFRERFATSMATTTGGADPRSNLLMAQYNNYLRTHGLPLPEASHQYPFPIGGRYAANNMETARKIPTFAGLGEANPKRHNFAQNFMGNRRVATMDEQMTSGMTPGLMMPPPGKYGLYEQVLAEEAALRGVDPINFQEVAWAGFKKAKEPDYTGQPMISVVNEAIERTHRLTGMPKDEIVRRGLVRGEIPIYGVVPPGAIMGELARQDRYGEQ